MRIDARSPLGERVATVTLDCVDVKMVAAWADPEAGEAGIYPHEVNADGTIRLTGEQPETKRGTVAMTFHDPV